jgi:hypothetical protein
MDMTEGKMVLGYQNGTLLLLSLEARSIVEQKRVQVEHSEPLLIKWHGEGAMFLVFFAHGLMCGFDCALQRLSLVGEKGQSITSFSFSTYMTSSKVTHAEWGPPPVEHLQGEHQLDPNTLCVIFERGPLVLLRLSLGLRAAGFVTQDVDGVATHGGSGQLRPRNLMAQRLRNREWAEAEDLIAQVYDGAEKVACLMLLLNALFRVPGKEEALLDIFRDSWPLYSSPSHPFHARMHGLYTRLFRQLLARMQFEVSSLARTRTRLLSFNCAHLWSSSKRHFAQSTHSSLPLSQEAFFVAKQINSHACFAELHAWALQSQQRVLADLVADLLDLSKGDHALVSPSHRVSQAN